MFCNYYIDMKTSNGMNKHFEQKFRAAPGTSLSEAERARMREELVRHMESHPLPAASPRAMSWSSQLAWSSYVARAGAFAALLLVAGGGVSFAAENALPGNPLYAVKRSITEPVRAALAVTAEEKASWSAEAASRRLAEAEALASRGALDAQTARNLGDDFEQSAKAAADELAVLRETNPDEANVASAKLAASLSAHESVLGALGGAVGASHVQETALRVRASIAAGSGERVRAAAAHTTTATVRATEAVKAADTSSPSATSSFADTEAPAFKQAALEARAKAAASLARNRSALSKEQQAKADAVLADIDTALSDADRELQIGGDPSDALKNYKRALDSAQGLPVLLRAAASLKLPILDGAAAATSSDEHRGDATSSSAGSAGELIPIPSGDR